MQRHKFSLLNQYFISVINGIDISFLEYKYKSTKGRGREPNKERDQYLLVMLRVKLVLVNNS